MKKEPIQMKALLDGVLLTFNENVKKVEALACFDEAICEQVISTLKAARAVSTGAAQQKIDNGLKTIKTLRSHGSLKDQYKTIYNQCLVLLVSYFGDAVSEIFNVTVPFAIRENRYLKSDKKNEKQELKITTDDLKKMAMDFNEHIGEIITLRENVSFQDMQSIHRTFNKYIGINIQRTTITDTIIFAHASRHVIVHAAGIITDKMIEQIAQGAGRVIKKVIKKGDELIFNPEEIKSITQAMVDYLEELVRLTSQQIFFDEAQLQDEQDFLKVLAKVPGSKE